MDWHDSDPIGALSRLWRLWKPQMDAYFTAALIRRASFGVPGDL
jgi:uncharacterized Ntn-hydrolase superfamily protein